MRRPCGLGRAAETSRGPTRGARGGEATAAQQRVMAVPSQTELASVRSSVRLYPERARECGRGERRHLGSLSWPRRLPFDPKLKRKASLSTENTQTRSFP